MSNPEDKLSFWGHLDQLRGVLFRVILATLLFGILAFVFRDEVFDVILAPRQWDFITYRLFNSLSNTLSAQNLPLEQFSVELINTALSGQFIVHLKTSFFVGVVCVMPYILYVLFRFISPALYHNERRATVRIISSGYVMFMAGVALTYFLIFPLTFRFLGTYQVSSEVANNITLQSYLGTFTMLSLAMGVVFEIPIVCWLLSRFGLVNARLMRKFRRHVVVGILVLSAIITPTTDAFTLFLVALPMYLLYEGSILIVRGGR